MVQFPGDTSHAEGIQNNCTAFYIQFPPHRHANNYVRAQLPHNSEYVAGFCLILLLSHISSRYSNESYLVMAAGVICADFDSHVAGTYETKSRIF
jgi:hypothetical protein